MKTDSIEKRVFAVTHEVLRVSQDKMLRVSNFKADLGADSLDLVSLMMALEEEFGGSISDEEAAKMTTIGDAIELIEQKALVQGKS